MIFFSLGVGVGAILVVVLMNIIITIESGE